MSDPEKTSGRAEPPNEPERGDLEGPPPGVRAMAIVRWVIIAAMALGAAISILYFAGAFKSSGQSGVTQYYCPMHPSVVQDHPGECPICSMTLVPREAAAQGGPALPPAPQPASGVPGLGTVTLTPERIQLIGMRAARVTKELLSEKIQTVAFVAADESKRAEITTRFDGYIEQLLVGAPGDRVVRGDVLATIYSPELLSAQGELLNAIKWSSQRKDEATGFSASLAEASRRKLELLGISEPEIAEIERSGHSVHALKIRSTLSGFITRKEVVLGSRVQAGAVLFEVADLSSLWLLADVYESEIPRVKLSAVATFTLAAIPDRAFRGKVDFMYPSIDPETRTLRVRIQLPNKDLSLRPGMYGDVSLEAAPVEALVIPAEALIDTGRAQYVFLTLEGGRFEPRRVRVGARAEEKVQILEGLEAGDLVVTTSNFVIDSESRLFAAISGIAAEGDAAAAPSAPDSSCDRDFDKGKFADKYRQCRACEVVHRGMGTMEQDCKNAILKPWR